MFENYHDKASNTKKCPLCGSNDIIYLEDQGITVCSSCGTVLEENIITMENEKRFFTPVDKIVFKRTVNVSRSIAPNIKHYFVKTTAFKDKNCKIENAQERKLRMYSSLLSELCSKLAIPDNIKRDAFQIIFRFVMKKSIHNKDAEALIAAALFISMRNNGRYEPLDRFLKESKISKKAFSKLYRAIKDTLNVKVELPTAEKYTELFGRKLFFSQECINLALKILSRIRLLRPLISSDPASLAAATLYYASLITGEKRSQRQIAEVAATTETTIRNRLKEITNILNESKEFALRTSLSE